MQIEKNVHTTVSTSSLSSSGFSQASPRQSKKLPDIPDVPISGETILSRADRRLEKVVSKLNQKPNKRLEELMRRTSNKKAIEMTGRTASQIEKGSLESKSFKAFEARFDKASHRSNTSVSGLRESTERTVETRKKYHGMKRAITEFNRSS